MLNWQEIILRIYDLYEVKTQKSLAECLGVTRGLVSRWHMKDESKRCIPTWETMAKIVTEKQVSWDWLLEGRGPRDRDEYAPKEKQ